MNIRQLLLLGSAGILTSPGFLNSFAAAQEDQVQRQETITVTAQKREQSLQDVAGSVAAFDAVTIEERGLSTIESLVQATPGLVYQESSGSSQLTVRGVGLLVNTGVAEPAVGTHIDGVFQPRASVSAIQFLDLERIEVLRGPQGTLYGRNTTGGTVNFVLAKPAEEFEGFGAVGLGSYNEISAKAYFTGPIAGDKMLGRLSAVYSERDGFYDNINTGSEPLSRQEWGVRGALRIVPTSDITIDLSAFHQEEQGSYPLQHSFNGNPFVDGLVLGGFLPAGSVIIPDKEWETADDTEPFTEVETNMVSLEANWTVSDKFQIKSITGFTDHQLGPQVFDADGTSLGIVNIGSTSNPRLGTSEALSQEFNFSGTSAADRLDWLVGLYYFHEDHEHSIPSYFVDPLVQTIVGAAFAPVLGDGARFTDQQQQVSETTESQAIFADVTYSLTDKVRVGAGARYTDDSKEIDQTLIANATAGVGGPVPFGTPVPLPLCEDQRTDLGFSDTNFKVRGEWDVDADAMLYGQWQNGFKDGGVNLGVCGDEFDKEEIEALEIGVKTSWLNGAFVLNASAFSYDYSNMQTLAFRNTTDSFIYNIPQAEIMGAEIEAVARPTDDFSVDLGLALLDTEIKEAESFDTFNPAAGVQDLAGNDLPSSPSYTLLLGANYEWDIGMGSIDLRGEIFNSDSYNFRVFSNPEDEQENYSLINLYATYRSPGDRYLVRAFVKNLSDEAHYKFLLFSPLVGQAGEYAEPRTFGVELGMHF